MAETRNIVILGGGFAGMGMAHYFMKHMYPTLKKDAENATYRLIIVDQATQFWWHIAAPRQLVAQKLMPQNKTFFPLEDGFKQYGPDKAIISFMQAQPTSVDTEARTVTIKANSASASAADNTPAHTETITYHALILATGTRTPTPLTSFHGDHTLTTRALDEMNSRLNAASSVVISGGGPIGVESAGEIGEALNGNAGMLQARPANAKVKITLLAGGAKLLPVLSEARAKKAEAMLAKVGVDVVYGKRVASVADADADGKTTVTLDDGSTLTADVYLPATGVTPNTDFLPKPLLNERGYVRTHATSLRVEAAGARVYAVGDVGDYSRGGVLELHNAVPVAGANFAHDLGLYPDSKGGVKSADREFKANTAEMQVVPVGSKRGVGAFNGHGLPSMMVKMVKGKDYFASTHEDITHGKKYVKA